MTGAIRTRNVVAHAYTVVRLYGWRIFWRCVRAGFYHTDQTFLAIITAKE